MLDMCVTTAAVATDRCPVAAAPQAGSGAAADAGFGRPLPANVKVRLRDFCGRRALQDQKLIMQIGLSLHWRLVACLSCAADSLGRFTFCPICLLSAGLLAVTLTAPLACQAVPCVRFVALLWVVPVVPPRQQRNGASK